MEHGVLPQPAATHWGRRVIKKAAQENIFAAFINFSFSQWGYEKLRTEFQRGDQADGQQEERCGAPAGGVRVGFNDGKFFHPLSIPFVLTNNKFL